MVNIRKIKTYPSDSGLSFSFDLFSGAFDFTLNYEDKYHTV